MKNRKTLQRAMALGLLLSLGYQGSALGVWPFSKPKPPKNIAQKALELAQNVGKHIYKNLSEKETQTGLTKLFCVLGAGAVIGNIMGKILKPSKNEKETPTIKKANKETQSTIPNFPHFFHHIANNQEHLITNYNDTVYIAKQQGDNVLLQSHRLVQDIKNVQIREFNTQTSNNITSNTPELYVMAGEVFGINVQDEIQRIQRQIEQQESRSPKNRQDTWAPQSNYSRIY